MDAEIYEVLGSYKDAIDVILEKLEEQAKELSAVKEENAKLNSILFDEILEPARLAFEERSKSDRFDEFNEKFGERLDPYSETLGKVYDDPEYSFVKDAFDQYDAMEPKPEGEDFVNAIIDKAENQIEEIKQRLGIDDGTEVEIKQDENGNTEVVADGQVVASEEEAPAEEEKAEATAEDVAKEEEKEPEEQAEFDFDGEEGAEESNPEELKKYEEELAKLI